MSREKTIIYLQEFLKHTKSQKAITLINPDPIQELAEEQKNIAAFYSIVFDDILTRLDGLTTEIERIARKNKKG